MLHTLLLCACRAFVKYDTNCSMDSPHENSDFVSGRISEENEAATLWATGETSPPAQSGRWIVQVEADDLGDEEVRFNLEVSNPPFKTGSAASLQPCWQLGSVCAAVLVTVLWRREEFQ